MTSRLIMAGLFSLILMMPLGSAYAQDSTEDDVERAATSCPDLGTPTVKAVSYTGTLLQSHKKTAFEIAREKSVRYNVKMPMRQGNNGQALFRVAPFGNIGGRGDDRRADWHPGDSTAGSQRSG